MKKAIGYVRVPVAELADQFQHEEEYNLYDNLGNLSRMKVLLNLQWVHSQVKYLDNVI